MSAWSRGVVLALILGCAILPSLAAENMIGRQSQNEGMLAVPAPGKVVIDGDLKDWDWSGRIWVFADTVVRNRYSVEAAAMWDADYLYLAAKWKDPTPMYSTVDPAVNPDEGWKSDSWQMRVTTADSTVWITNWYFTPKKQAVMQLCYWKDPVRYTSIDPTLLLVTAEGGSDLGHGAAMAYKADADGKGFVQEMRIPWTLIYKTKPDVKAGLALRMGNEFLWGDATGKTWPVHRYADNMQPGKTSREFYWTARDAWGDVKLAAKGNQTPRQYIADAGTIAGTVPVRAVLPADAARFTLVIEDQLGRRVRNLAADCDPALYRVSMKSGKQVVEVKWDGLDDKGKLAAPGAYRVRGLTHTGLSAEYEMCFYNPGTPPWATRDGRGAWGADHSAPIAVAAGGDWTFVTWPVVEGGSGIIGIDPNGQKRWSDRRGISKVTADAHYVYAYVSSWYTGSGELCRYNITDGALAPFVVDGKPRVFDLTLKDLLGVDAKVAITGMTVHGDTLALALSTGTVVLLDAASATPRKELAVAGIGEIAYAPNGRLYGLNGAALCRLDSDTGTATPIPTPGLGKPVALTADGAGNLLIADGGPDSQIKAYAPDGTLVYTCGKRGGRPIRGTYDPQGMLQMSSVAVDAQQRVWVVESWNYPRRVSVWGRDGKLIRDYLGNTGYAGTNCYLHDQDPTLAYCGPLEFKLDKTANTWTLSRILWLPDTAKGESFLMSTGSNTLPQRFTSAASGTPHEYLYLHEPNTWEGTGQVLLMERNGQWQPVAAICAVGHITGKFGYGGAVLEAPSGEFAGFNGYDAVIWNDANGDGKVQRSECTIVTTDIPGTDKQAGRSALALNNGWGGRIGDDLSIYTDGLTRYRPLRFTRDGAPVYGLDGRIPLATRDWGDIVPIPGEATLVCLSMDGYAGPTKLTGIDSDTGQVKWYYANPYPGVHGSHNATMPRPGLLIGPLKTMGTANMGPQVGNVFAMRGNLGEDYFMTSDGLFVGALFQDGRLPYEALPDSEDRLKGMPMEGFSEGGEPFNGWFGRQSDGKVRLTTGMAREAGMIMRINGLESIRRLPTSTLTVDNAALVKAETENIARVAAAGAPKQYTITHLPAPLVIDGETGDWTRVPALTIAREGSPNRATVKLAYDATNLYALFEVDDASPWRNEGKDLTRLFKTGDAVDLQFTSDPTAPAKRGNILPGDQRIVIAPLAGKPAVVLMRPLDATAPAGLRIKFASPIGDRVFDRVEVLPATVVARVTDTQHYRVEVAIPLEVLKLTPKSGMVIHGDVGIISSDAQGMIDVARTYWSNTATNLVNDLPLEAWLYPQAWGELTFE